MVFMDQILPNYFQGKFCLTAILTFLLAASCHETIFNQSESSNFNCSVTYNEYIVIESGLESIIPSLSQGIKTFDASWYLLHMGAEFDL